MSPNNTNDLKKIYPIINCGKFLHGFSSFFIKDSLGLCLMLCFFFFSPSFNAQKNNVPDAATVHISGDAVIYSADTEFNKHIDLQHAREIREIKSTSDQGTLKVYTSSSHTKTLNSQKLATNKVSTSKSKSINKEGSKSKTVQHHVSKKNLPNFSNENASDILQRWSIHSFALTCGFDHQNFKIKGVILNESTINQKWIFIENVISSNLLLALQLGGGIVFSGRAPPQLV